MDEKIINKLKSTQLSFSDAVELIKSDNLVGQISKIYDLKFFEAFNRISVRVLETDDYFIAMDLKKHLKSLNLYTDVHEKKEFMTMSPAVAPAVAPAGPLIPHPWWDIEFHVPFSKINNTNITNNYNSKKETSNIHSNEKLDNDMIIPLFD